MTYRRLIESSDIAKKNFPRRDMREASESESSMVVNVFTHF